jgi:hypothetical protein
MMALALCAVVCVAVLSDKMGGSAELVQTELHSSRQDYDVADAILSSAGIHDKKGSISASMASLAAQVPLPLKRSPSLLLFFLFPLVLLPIWMRRVKPL